MPVYVDPLFICVRNPKWRWGMSCHLFADTVEELHEFARRLKMNRAWLQVSRRGLIHYDLPPKRREKAVELGAIELSRREAATKIRNFVPRA